MSAMTSEIFIIVVLIIINGLLSMSEIALVSARKPRLQQLADEGDRGAQAALELSKNPNQFLSTVQIGITLVGILAGAFGGATIAEQLGGWIAGIPFLADYSEAIGVVIVVLVITYFSLVIGELVPKRLGLHNPEQIASTMAGPMGTLAFVTGPAVGVLTFSTDHILRLAGLRQTDEPSVTEEEIKIMIEQGTQEGVFEAAEQNIVERVFRLADRSVGELMTPRPKVAWLDLDDDLETCTQIMLAAGYSYFPVCRENLDQVLGVVSVKSLWAAMAGGQEANLEKLLVKPLIVPETMPALRLLESFKQYGAQAALVIDEYGGVDGIVTVMDVLEAMVGDIASADEPADLEAVQREDGSWLIDGLLPAEEVREIFNIALLPGEEDGSYQTLGGFMMTHLGRVPEAGDYFEWNKLRFEVVDMDGNRVDKVLVAPLAADTPGDTAEPAEPS
jgi:putative hemolysin